MLEYTFTIGPLGFFVGSLVKGNFKFGFSAGKSRLTWFSGSIDTLEILVWIGRRVLVVEKMRRRNAG